MNPQAKRVVVIVVILAILGAIGYGLWRAAKLGTLNAFRASSKATPTAKPTPSPTGVPASGASAAAGPGEGNVLSAADCEDCANAYGQISLSPGNSLSRLPRHLRYEGGKWGDSPTFSVNWNMAGAGNNRVFWKTDGQAQITWRRAYLVSYGGETTEVDLRNHPDEIIFKMGTVRDVALYGTYATPPADAGPVPSKNRPTLP